MLKSFGPKQPFYFPHYEEVNVHHLHSCNRDTVAELHKVHFPLYDFVYSVSK